MLRNNSCNSNVVKESFKNAKFFLCTFYHILWHNFWGNTPKSIAIFRIKKTLRIIMNFKKTDL